MIPFKRTEEYVEFILDKLAPLEPIWLCPIRSCCGSRRKENTHRYLFLIPTSDNDLFMDIGVYGTSAVPEPQIQKANEELLKTMREMGGRQVYMQCLIFSTNVVQKGMYSYVDYSSSKEFWKDYKEDTYNELRNKYSAEGAFPNIWQKVSNPKKRSKCD